MAVMPWLDQGIHRAQPSPEVGPRVKPEDDGSHARERQKPRMPTTETAYANDMNHARKRKNPRQKAVKPFHPLP